MKVGTFTKTYVHTQYLEELVLEWEMFQTSCEENQNTFYVQ